MRIALVQSRDKTGEIGAQGTGSSAAARRKEEVVCGFAVTGGCPVGRGPADDEQDLFRAPVAVFSVG